MSRGTDAGPANPTPAIVDNGWRLEPAQVVCEPALYLLGRSAVQQGMDAFRGDFQLPRDESRIGSPERLVEAAGRNCYWSYAKPRPGGNAAYIANLLKSGHGSCLEVASWNLLITGISRSLSHELIRHRCMSYSQLSQRYVDSSAIRFVIPPAYLVLPLDHRIRVLWGNMCADALATYRQLVKETELLPEIQAIKHATDRRKAARESARSVLPNCTETRIVVTLNARAARHFLNLRGSLHADAEIRRLALALYDLLADDTPAFFADFRVQTASCGRTYLVSDYGSI